MLNKFLPLGKHVAQKMAENTAPVRPDMNLNCPSVQARLATVWGYVKAEPVKQEPVAWTDAQISRAFKNSPELHKDVTSFTTFKRVVKAVEAMHGYAAPVQPVKQEPVACHDSDDRRLLREIFMLCEATEEIEATNDFMRGRIFEAKGIRRGIGTWYLDTFCGRSYMGEPVIPAAPVDAKAIRAEAFAGAKEHFSKQLVGFRASVREQALEEAAKMAEAYVARGIGMEMATAIRGLK